MALEQLPPQAHESKDMADALLEKRDIVERISLVRKSLQWLGTHMHPNHITAIRLPLTAVAAAIDTISHTASTLTFAVTSGLDWVDGAVARSTPGKETREGAMLDPAVDKVCHAIALGYLVTQHIDDLVFATAALVSVVLNIVKQAQRGSLGEQIADAQRGLLTPGECHPITSDAEAKKMKASGWGKIKHMLEVTAITGMFAGGEEQWVRIAAAVTLALSSLVNVKDILKKMRGKKSA